MPKILISYTFILLLLESAALSQSLLIEDLLPQKGEAANWFPDGNAEYAAGDDLYLLINGGAEIYQEYGFKKAVFQSYLSLSGQSLNLEIYQMTSSDAAYGMYTFKTGEHGSAQNFGDESWLESYYLNIWKGDYLITIIGMDTDQTMIDGLKQLATAVDGKILDNAQRPQLTTFLPEDNLRQNGIIYLKGNLALFNQYPFDTKNIFGMAEGVIGNYNGYSIYIFKYDNQPEAMKWLQSIQIYFKESDSYTNFNEDGDSFKVEDKYTNTIVFKPFKKCIIVIIGQNLSDTSSLFTAVKKKIHDYDLEP